MKLFNWIRRDGLLHIETSALIVIVLSLFCATWIAVISSLLCGIAKEVWDIKHGVTSWHDIICDIVGILAAVALIAIAQ